MAADQIPRNDKEDVNAREAAVNPWHSGVVKDHAQNGYGTDSVDVGPIRAVRDVALRNAQDLSLHEELHCDWHLNSAILAICLASLVHHSAVPSPCLL
jgi:hypothetical protein